jgi:hypothetical protein
MYMYIPYHTIHTAWLVQPYKFTSFFVLCLKESRDQMLYTGTTTLLCGIICRQFIVTFTNDKF